MKKIILLLVLAFIIGCGPTLQGGKITYWTGQGWYQEGKSDKEISMDYNYCLMECGTDVLKFNYCMQSKGYIWQ